MFRWRYLDGSGADIGSSQRFSDQESAESWLAESWMDLRDRGVEEVALLDETGGGAIYRMGLAEA